MSSSKFDLGGSSLLGSQKPQIDLGGALTSPTKATSASLGLNPLISSSNNVGLSNELIDSSGSSANALQIGDLLPNQSSNALDSLASPLTQEEKIDHGTIEVTETRHIVHLSSVGAGKVAVVKAIRAHWGTGLKRSKELADAAPTDLPALPTTKAQAAQMELSNLGAVVSVRSADS